MRIEELAELQQGTNNSRLITQVGKEKIYDASDLECDLATGYQGKPKKSQKDEVVAGDLVFHLMSNKAAIVSEVSEHKYISQLMVKLICNEAKIDSWYLCYLLNESQAVKHQQHQSMEGTVLRRNSKKDIASLDIELPAIELQRQLGTLYRESLGLYYEQLEQAERIKTASLALIRESNPND